MVVDHEPEYDPVRYDCLISFDLDFGVNEDELRRDLQTTLGHLPWYTSSPDVIELTRTEM